MNNSRRNYERIEGRNDQVTNIEQTQDKQVEYDLLNQAQKEKLEYFFQHIILNASLDYTIQEIQDIQDAVQTMLERISTKVNRRGVFNITRIVPTGSMAEKTAIWKYDYDEEGPYLEFDNLAVLKESVRQCEVHSDYQKCPGCITISYTPVELTRMRKHDLDVMRKRLCEINPTHVCIDKDMVNEIFLHEINNCLASSCNCLTLQCKENTYSFEPSRVDNNDGCDKCTVDTPTGTLSVNTNKHIERYSDDPNKCSLIFKWTSKTNSLLAPDTFLQQKQPITSMPIYIDFLPAIELLKPTLPCARFKHDYFVVPKRCNVCDNFDVYSSWRRSWCMTEIQAFKTGMSDKHRRCYQITKYLASFGSKYLIKNVVLKHSTTCSDTSNTCVDCVIEVYQDIVNAYNRREFLSYHSNINILSNTQHRIQEILEDYYQRFLTQLYSVSETDTFDKFVSRLYLSSDTAGY